MLVTFGLGSPSLLPTLGLGAGATSGKLTITVGMKQHVIATDEPRPLIGSHAERLEETAFDIRGFHFDRKRWVDELNIRTFNPGEIGNITDGVTDGTVLDHWLSGIGDGHDGDVVDIVENQNEDELKWSPRVHRGEYFSHVTPYYLFGDGHVMHPAQTGFAESFDVESDFIDLEFTPDSNSPIVAGVYRREADRSAFPWRVADLVPSFTGVITEPGTRASTINDDGTPDYTSVDNFLRWETYHDTSTNRLYFNKNMASLFGSLSPDAVSDLELIGTSDNSGGQRMFTRYFPIDPGVQGSTITHKHVLYVGDTPWSVADDNDLSFHAADDQVYQIDYDLGLIEFGGRSIDATLFAAGNVGIADTEIELIGDVDALPAKGILLIGTEQVAYAGRTDTAIVQVTRGWAGTTAAAHSQNATLSYMSPGAIPANGLEIRMGYYTTPRIEYAANKETGLTVADDVNARPSNVPEGNGIVYITRTPLALESLLLEVNKPLISGNIYGPVSVGADYALLTATATSPLGEPVPRLPITIEETSAPPFIGLLNGAPSSYNSLSNYSGQISSSFVVGSDISAIFLTADAVVQSSGQTLVTLAGEHTDFELDELFIYTITKDDPMQGTVGALCTYDSGSLSTSDLLPGSNQKLSVTTLVDASTVTVSDVYADDVFNGGTVRICKTDGTFVEGTIKYWREGTVYLEESLVVADGDIDLIILLKPDWTEWNPSTLNGKRRVLYEYNPNAINPVSGALGAYFPIQPSSRTYDSASNQTTFVFDELLPLPDANDISNNVGGYLLTIPRIVSFRAQANDPLTGRLILSNTLDLKIFVPDYLSGIYLTDSGKIPYGFRIRDDSLDAASGLDGAVFVTINPVAGSSGAVSNPFASMIHLISV